MMLGVSIIYLSFLLQVTQLLAAPLPSDPPSLDSNAGWLKKLRPVQEFTQSFPGNSNVPKIVHFNTPGTPSNSPPPNSIHEASPSGYASDGRHLTKLDPASEALRKEFYRNNAKLKAAGRTTFTPDTLESKKAMLSALNQLAKKKGSIPNMGTTKTWLQQSIGEQERRPKATGPAILREGPDCHDFRRLRKEIEEEELELIFAPLEKESLTADLIVKYGALTRTSGWESMSYSNPVKSALYRKDYNLKHSQSAKFPTTGSKEHSDYLELVEGLDTDWRNIPKGPGGVAARRKIVGQLKNIKANKYYKGLDPYGPEKKMIQKMMESRVATLEGYNRKIQKR